ncbi:glycosyltransferase family 2 protein [Salinicoccus sp. ID82-1]|uniref:Glycosyltransferase family 2 protein n=1 Tax=Salinicoccus cyprini TaxID=2493691 RepID=A0A558AY48_9STAP|nr:MULTISPECIES: glycosyltransferase family 2 protein [Salinicoccus]MCG1008709.1 glycosyltransferase family 2 protein [Salinicoccus sp. ID82-1]TVT29184.1 glycosyltransferase family 2 protein [Salinicoccus cyprini]
MISIVVPVLNEAENIPALHTEIVSVMKVLGRPYEVIFIDDGSTDGTLTELREIAGPKISYLSFSRNFGKEAAIIAGLEKASGDAVIIMDGDMQHPPSLIAELIEQYEAGFDQVVAKRNKAKEPLSRRLPSKLFYQLMNFTSTVHLEDGEGDFRLISRKVVEAILTLSENNRFSKGIFEWVGFNKTVIEFDHIERESGSSTFNPLKLLDYAIDGISAFNHRPLRVCFYLGLVVLMASLAYILYMFVNIAVHGVEVPGYFTIIASLLLLGSIQLFSLGIIGEYVGRIYIETKNRPKYIVRESSGNETKQGGRHEKQYHQ